MVKTKKDQNKTNFKTVLIILGTLYSLHRLHTRTRDLVTRDPRDPRACAAAIN